MTFTKKLQRFIFFFLIGMFGLHWSNSCYCAAAGDTFSPLIEQIPYSEIVEFGRSLGGGAEYSVVAGSWKDNPIAIKMVALSGPHTDSSPTTRDGTPVFDGSIKGRLSAALTPLTVSAKLPRADDPYVRLRHEAQMLVTAKSLKCNVCEVLGLSGDGSSTMLVLKFYSAGNLFDYICNKKVSIEQRFKFALDIAQGLHVLHTNNIVHCDLKPQNCLIDSSGGPYDVVLADFELSKQLTPKKSITIDDFGNTGTQAYLSPECNNYGSASKVVVSVEDFFKRDIWAFGCLLGFIFSGREPYGGKYSCWYAGDEIIPTFSLIDGTPDGVRKLIEQCLDIEPKKRPAAETVAADLESAKLDCFSRKDKRKEVNYNV